MELLDKAGLGKFFFRKPIEKPTNQEGEFALEPNRMYMLIGGDEKELLTKCPNCGNGYRGHKDQMCQSCNTPRKVFYLETSELENHKPANKNESYQLVIPEFSEGTVEMGEKSQANFIIGKNVSTSYNCTIGTVLADSLYTYIRFRSKLVIAKDISLGTISEVDCVVARKGGTVDIGAGSHVGLLVIEGPLKKLTIQDQSRVDKTFHVGVPRHLSMGQQVTMTQNKMIGIQEYSQILKGITQFLPSY